MPLDGMKRVLEIHAGWLKDWRASVEQMESGKVRHLIKGPGDRDWVDCMQEMAEDASPVMSALRRQIRDRGEFGSKVAVGEVSAICRLSRQQRSRDHSGQIVWEVPMSGNCRESEKASVDASWRALQA